MNSSANNDICGWSGWLRLMQLSARRCLPPGGWLLLIGSFALLASNSDAPAAASLSDTAPLLALRGWIRQSLWAALFAIWAPILVLRSLLCFNRWRDREALWLGSTPLGRSALVLCTFVGCALTGLLVLGLWAAATEWVVLRSSSTELQPPTAPLRFVQRLPSGALFPVSTKSEPPAPLRIPIDLENRVGRGPLQLSLNVRALGPGSLELQAGFEDAALQSHILQSHAQLEVSWPEKVHELAPDAQAALLLRGQARQSPFVIPAGGIQIFEPDNRAWPELKSLLPRASLALCVWIALALGLGAWMGAGWAIALLACLQLGVWLSDAGPGSTHLQSAFLPAFDWPTAMGWIGRGRLPTSLPLQVFWSAALWVFAGLGLARWGLHSWRTPN